MKRSSQASDLWSRIDSARSELIPPEAPIPSNAITLQQYMDRYKVCRSTAQCQVRNLVQKGLLCQGFKQVWAVTHRQQVRVYWPTTN